jgi:Ca2+-binding EF-hand superfamily protein
MKTLILGGVALAALAATAAVAQPAAPAAPMADGPMRHHREMRSMTRADFQQRLQQHFARLDANHDGFVDQSEAEAAHGARGWATTAGAPNAPRAPHAPMDRNAMFDRLDANHDGTITRGEFLAFHSGEGRRGMRGAASADGPPMAHGEGMAYREEASGPRPMRRAGMGGFGGRAFERMDANHDGRVSLDEANRAAMAMFDRLDANHDGVITPDERGAARQRLRGRMDDRREQ